MTAQVQTEPVMSDALFSCVYRWINGHTINEIDTIAAMQRHKHEDPLSLLAKRLKSLSPGNTDYDRMCDQGYIQTDSDKQRGKRTELVLEYLTPESLNSLLADTDRLNRLFPPEPKAARKTKLPLSVGSVGYDARQDYVIKGYLPALSLCSIYGPSGSYKSFLAVSWACHIASGKAWSGKRVSPGAVLYVVGEGGIGVPRRIKAWEKVYNGDKPLTSLYLVNRPVFPVRHQEVDEVLLAVQNVQEATGLKVELIVLDTLARCFGGSDENDARDMGAFIEGCDTIKRKSGATVLVVHHSGKDEAKGARGSSAFRAALDAEFNIKREDENKALVLTCTKMKDAEEPQRCAYDLRTAELFHDEDDELISSLVVMDTPREVKENDPALAGVTRLSDNHVALWQSIRSRTAKGEACTRALLRDDLKVVLGEENVRKGFGRWLEKLKSEGLIGIEGENITPLNSD
ncbi:TPA: helicase RepA family protein [Morganella morganii]|uniref:helicase RepA family protein n=1 Tax=Morganella morganii TaxID=582 RepID=UPI003BC94EFE